MADRRDVTGVWYGSWHSSHRHVAPGNFIATLDELAGSVSGSITERDPKGGGTIRRADVQGDRNGTKIHFVKQYDGSGGLTHAVVYSGQVNGEGTEIAGKWRLPGHVGSFAMQREKFDIEELEEEERVEEPVDALPLR